MHTSSSMGFFFQRSRRCKTTVSAPCLSRADWQREIRNRTASDRGSTKSSSSSTNCCCGVASVSCSAETGLLAGSGRRNSRFQPTEVEAALVDSISARSGCSWGCRASSRRTYGASTTVSVLAKIGSSSGKIVAAGSAELGRLGGFFHSRSPGEATLLHWGRLCRTPMLGNRLSWKQDRLVSRRRSERCGLLDSEFQQETGGATLSVEGRARRGSARSRPSPRPSRRPPETAAASAIPSLSHAPEPILHWTILHWMNPAQPPPKIGFRLVPRIPQSAARNRFQIWRAARLRPFLQALGHRTQRDSHPCQRSRAQNPVLNDSPARCRLNLRHVLFQFP